MKTVFECYWQILEITYKRFIAFFAFQNRSDYIRLFWIIYFESCWVAWPKFNTLQQYSIISWNELLQGYDLTEGNG